MPRTTFTPELNAMLPPLREAVAALNQLTRAYEEASGVFLDAFEDADFDDGAVPVGYDEHPAGILRDALLHHREDLSTTISCIANDLGVQLRFNRVGGEYILMDRT